MNYKNQTILVWDSAESPSSGYSRVALWQSFDSQLYPDAVFIPKIVEQNTDNLKNRYLKLIYNVGQIKLNGQSLIENFQLYPDFNYWWMTLLNEKSNWAKSLWINDAIRMLAFEDWSVNQKIKKLELVTSNTKLVKCFRLFCEKKKIMFKWQCMPEAKERESTIKRIFHVLPKPIQALVWLGYYVCSRRSLKGAGIKEWESTKSKTTFVSYLFNLEAEPASAGHFVSQYWVDLPDMILQEGIATNWLHLYVKGGVLPSARKGSEIINILNRTGEGKQVHTTLDAFMSWEVIWKTLIEWIGLFKIWIRIRTLDPSDLGGEFYIWPFIKMDLKESLFGQTAINSLLYQNLFEQALKTLPKKGRCFYLQENQGWEFGLIQAWKSLGNGEIIGVPHSTIRFWDLRYFFDTRVYNDNVSKQLPRPDRVAVNGKAARDSYIQGGYPQNELVEVEALRYQYLNTFLEKSDFLANNSTHIMLLVLGDYLAENSHCQMRILEKAFSSFSQNVKLIVKPHPSCPIIAEDYPDLKMHITMDPISNLLNKCDVAYTSVLTSAAIDAYCANVPVISVLNPQTLNMSPLRMMEGVEFISDADELVNAIKKIKNNNYNKIEPEDIFWLDPKLLMWKNLLNLR